MDAKELMITDLVMCRKIQEKYARVTEIYLTSDENPKRMVSLDADGARYCMPIESIEPIPLTAEILVKNGFEKSGSFFIIYNDYYSILVFELSDSIWQLQYTDNEMGISNAQMNFSYVHELQHTMRFLGIDKRIVL